MTKSATKVIVDRLLKIREWGWRQDFSTTSYADDLVNDLDAAGYVIVPKVPTAEMIQAGAETSVFGDPNFNDLPESQRESFKRDEARDFYEAMISVVGLQ